ncbi:hypothetical protein IPH67_05635 [bacterium]|nr:MAG: hypothetical protein IPH67_05635 [bacterium]
MLRGVKRIKLSTLDYGAATYFIISRAEAASNLGRFDGVRYGHRAKDTHGIANMYQKTRYEGFGAEVRKRIMVGNYVLSAGHAGQFTKMPVVWCDSNAPRSETGFCKRS